MVTRVALVSCVKQKRDTSAPARDLYLSQLFLGFRRYAESRADSWYILSAEHGVLCPEQVVAPYERTLHAMPKRERVSWGWRVRLQLLDLLPSDAEIVLLAGMRYREEIEPFLRERFPVSVPMEGLRIGEQLRWLRQQGKTTRGFHEHLDRFHEIIARLGKLPGQMRPLRELPPRSKMPARGIYFFFEPGEFRSGNCRIPRIVRVGTHAISTGSKSTLRGRLKQHLGTRAGGGNHRGSIFRLHVGAALLAREGKSLPSWGVGYSMPRSVRDDEAACAEEAAWEARVSEYIGTMSVVWIGIPDDAGPESDRAYLEKNAIALLSNQLAPIDAAGAQWLGRFSPRQQVRDSSLWNLNHVESVCDLDFLDKLESYVTAMRGTP
jgi:hypothetical protein